MNTKRFVNTAMIAAVYTVLTLVLAPFSYGNIQVRIAEALTMLPLVSKTSIKGVALGCFLSNLIGAMMGVNPTGFIDAIIGTAATLGAAYCTWIMKDIRIKGIPVPAMSMPVIWNFFFVGAELGYLFMPENILLGTIINGFYVALGEIVAVILGYVLVKALNKQEVFRKIFEE